MQKIQAFITESLLPEIAAQKARAFLWAPVCFAVGIAVYFGLKSEPVGWLGMGLSVFVALVTLGVWKIQQDALWQKALMFVSVGVFIASLGFTAAQIKSHLVYTPMLLKKMSPVGIEGTIASLEPMEEKAGSRVILEDVVIERLAPDKTPRHVRLSIRKDEGLQAGQRIKILAGLNPASGSSSPAGFDFQRMAYFQGIGAVGFAYSTPEILAEAPARFFSLKKIRQILNERITAQTQAPQQSIIVALMTGQRGSITDDDWKALRNSGLAHLLAISGLHVGMVAGVLLFSPAC